MFWRCIITQTCLWSMVGFASSQEVKRKDSISGLLISAELRAMDDSPKGPLPELKSAEDGTMVMVTGDFHNADVFIVMGKKKFSSAELLRHAQELAVKLGRPKTNFEVAIGRRLQYVDLSFDNYVENDQSKSHSRIPIGRIVEEVSTWGLPQPMGIAIENDDDFSVTCAGQAVAKTSVFLPREIAPDSEVEYRIQRHWYGLVALLFVSAFLLSLFIYVPSMLVFRSKKRTDKAEPEEEKPTPTTLEQAQERYKNAQGEWAELRKQFKFRHLLPILAGILLLPSIPLLKDGFLWIPAGFDPRWIMLFPMVFGLPMLITMAIVRKRRKPEVVKPEDRFFKRFSLMMFPMMAVLIFMPLMIVFPQAFRWIPPAYIRPFIFSIMLGPMAIGIILTMRDTRKNRVRLGPGDADYDVAMEMAKKAKVTVSRVEINKDLTGVNAAASLFGRVMVTDGLREKMSPAERRAILAHEIGHIKGQHVPLLALAGLVIVTFLVVVMGQIRSVAENWPSGIRALVDSPLVIWIPQIFISTFLLSPIRRRAEFFADRFALEQTRDYSLVATALAKVHLFNGAPHTMTTKHERVATHPSLTKRLDSLRKIATEMGLPVDDSQVNQIFWGDQVTPEGSPA